MAGGLRARAQLVSRGSRRRGRVLRPHLGDPDGGQHRDRGHLPGARGPAARAAPAARVARGAGGGSRELARPVRLEGRTVVVGLTGGIACYKACEVVRLLVGAGARAPVIMSAGAQQFVTPLTLQDLRGERVLVSAGPTREPIDPVRYLPNLSSG